MKRKFTKITVCFVCVLLLLTSSFAISADYVDDTTYFRISCTVNGDTQTERGFSWFTTSKTDTQIKLYIDGVDVTDTVTISDAECTVFSAYYSHHLTVSDLTPGTTYTYTVGDGETWSDEGTFTTDDGDDSVSFIVYADVQASSVQNFSVAANAVLEAFSTVSDAEFMINLGDFTNNSTNSEWNYYAEEFDAISLLSTLVPVAGNHDSSWSWFSTIFNLDTSESVQTLNGVNYSFDYGNIHFTVLNTNDMIAISDSQLEWLENDLQSTDKDWKIVLMHKSSYTLGKDGKWPDATYLQETVTAICEANDVDLVLSGHDHQYLRTNTLSDGEVSEDGTIYVLSGTVGTKRYAIRPFLLNMFTPEEVIAAMTDQNTGAYYDGSDFDSVDLSNKGSVFCGVSVNGDTLEFTAYLVTDETGEVNVIDSFTITKEIGTNVITYTGDNTTDTVTYALNCVSSAVHLATYAIGEWLPTFLMNLPDILYSYFVNDIF